MTFDFTSLLMGASIALLIRNVIDYWRNAEYINHDEMGAMANWHLGFFVAWLPVVIIGFTGSIFPWWSGVIAVATAPLLSYLCFYPIRFLLAALKMIEKPIPPSHTGGHRTTGRAADG